MLVAQVARVGRTGRPVRAGAGAALAFARKPLCRQHIRGCPFALMQEAVVRWIRPTALLHVVLTCLRRRHGLRAGWWRRRQFERRLHTVGIAWVLLLGGLSWCSRRIGLCCCRFHCCSRCCCVRLQKPWWCQRWTGGVRRRSKQLDQLEEHHAQGKAASQRAPTLHHRAAPKADALTCSRADAAALAGDTDTVPSPCRSPA